MIISPVNSTSKGSTESALPITLNFSGACSYTFSNPPIILPSPILNKAIQGTASPPKSNPYPLSVSETATAFRPPIIAYNEPIRPITTTVRVIPCCCEMPNISEILKILSKLIAPVYNTIGNMVTTNETIRKNATRVLVFRSKRCSKY